MSAIIEACDYHGPYPGNFIPTLLATGDAVREQLGLDMVPVFPDAVRERPWVEMVRSRGFKPLFVNHRSSVRALAATLHHLGHKVDARLIRSHFTRFDLPAGIAARRIGARCIWHFHNAYPLKPARDFVKARVLGGQLCHRVIAVSEAIGEDSVQRGYPVSKVSVISNGIDTSRFANLPARDRARAQLALGLSERVALAFCWAPHRKGADVIVSAIQHEDATALLVRGADDDLASYVDERGGLPSNVRIVPPVDDPSVLFAAADVFVSASRREGFPYAIGEAMAAGLPVVSSRIPEATAYFDAPGVRTFTSEDVGDLAVALGDQLNPSHLRERGEANREFVNEHLGLNRHVSRVIALLSDELAAQRHCDRPSSSGDRMGR